MSKNSYVNANLISTYDTFANWLVKTNEIIYDMGTSVVTTNSSATPDVTTGNGYVNGFFGSNTMYVFTALHGGTPTAFANLNITSNVYINSNTTVAANLVVVGTANVTVNLNSVGIVANNITANNNLIVTNTAVLNTATAVVANIATANIATLEVTGTGTVLNLNVTNIANLNNANVVSANITTLGVTGLATFVNASVGTGTSNVQANTTQITISNPSAVATVNATTFSGTAANATLLNSQNGAFYTNATNITTGTLPWARLNANTVNTTGAFTLTGVRTHDANLVVNAANFLIVGNATVNATANQTTFYVANSTTNTSINPGIITFGGGATVNNTIYTGTANNANALGGYIANTAAPSDGFVLAWNQAESRIKWTNPAGISTALTSNSVIANASLQAGSNGTGYVLVAEGNTASTNLVMRANNISLTVDSGAVLFNSNAFVNSAVLSVGNTTANVTVNTTVIVVGNGTVSATINSTAFSRQANGATNLGPEGTGVNLSTLQSQITGNAATAYTNAVTIAANATNITTGTLNAGRLPSTIVNTSGAFTITGVHTRNANLIMNTANQILLGNATVNAVANQTSLAIYNSSSNVVANATTIVVGGTATINSTAFSRQANGATNFGPEGSGVTLSTLQTQITSNSANVVTYITTNNYTISGNVNFTGTTIGIGTASPSTSYKVDVVGNGRFSTGLEVSGGKSIFTEGSISGSAQGYVDYDFLLDFSNDVANTWRKIVTIASPNIQYSTIGFKIDIVEPKSNHATISSINNIITETYYVACVRANDTTLNTPDACYVSGPGNRIRAVKTSTGNYEIQIQNAAQFVEYRGRISVYAVNGTHTVTYSNGTSAATGTAQYNASDSTNGIERISGALHVSGSGGIRAITAPTQDSVQISGRAGGTSSFVATITPTILSASRTLTIPNVSGTIVTTGDSATVTNAMLAGSIADSKLSTISTADKVSVSALNIDGATDIGAAIADADLFIVDDGGAGANRKTAATRIRDYALNGNNFLSVMESLRANRAVHGGGTITVDSSNNVKWSTRFIVISNGSGSHFSTNGYFDIDCPTSGTITGVGGATNKTATSNGIPLLAWEAIYYILPIGSTNATVNANFRVVSYTSSLEIPSNWILICAHNGDLGNYYFPNGIILKANQSFASGTVTTASFWHAGNDGSGSGLDADLLDGLNSGSFLRSDTLTTWNGSASGTFRITCPAGASGTTGGGINSLEIFQPTPNADATINLHVSTDFGCHFGLDGTTNDLFVGGWSFGAVKHKVWHAGNDGTTSGLDADLLDGLHASTGQAINTIVARDGNGYIYTNYINSNTNETENPSINSFITSNGDGFYRKASKAHVVSQLGVASLSGATFTGAVSGRINPRVSSAASGDISPTIASFDQYNRTALSAAITINAPTGTPVNGNKLMFRLRDNGTARALTWNGTYRAVGVTLPTTTTASKTTYVGCIYNSDENTWDVIAVSTQA